MLRCSDSRASEEGVVFGGGPGGDIFFETGNV